MQKPNYFVLNSLDDFRTRNIGDCIWNAQDKLFHLAMNHKLTFPEKKQEDAFTHWQSSVPLVMDKYQQMGFLSDDRTQLFYALNWQHKQQFDQEKNLSLYEKSLLKNPAVAGPVLASSEAPYGDSAESVSVAPVRSKTGMRFIDFHLGGDGRVALIESNGSDKHSLRLVHLQRRWQLSLDWQDTTEDIFQPKRCWVDQHNRIWVASDTQLKLFTGEPLPHAYQPWADRFEPLYINPTPLRVIREIFLPPGRQLMALCANESQIYLLCMMSDGLTQELINTHLDPDFSFQWQQRQLAHLPLVTDIASVAHDRVFLQFYADISEAKHCDFACLLLSEESYKVEKRRYPMHSQLGVRFVRGDDQIIRYLSSDGPKQIIPLPQARYIDYGEARLNRVLDSGNPGTWWDRIYLDASIPAGCQLQIRVQAYEDYQLSPNDWHMQALPCKLSIASELPFYCSRYDFQSGHQGLYEILLQRANGEVRDIRGRYLQLEIIMTGDGRHTPTIECMRVAYPRISWQENFLPPLFHQQQDVVLSDSEEVIDENGEKLVINANGADVRERILSVFDGIFSPLEKRIAAAESWLLPQSSPKQHLPLLSSILGASLPGYWPEQRQRIWLACLSELQKWKGTYAGFCLALDIATDGALGKGQIVPVENYLMRRTFATILGIDMDDADHPLTLGTRQSGNSIVGETLFLSDETSREFMTLLAPELLSASDQQIEKKFLDDYAHRVSIVVHEDAFSHIPGIEKLIVEYVPASIVCKIIKTDKPFILGLSPLLGIDTYLQAAEEARQVVLDDTWLGREGIMRNIASFSPRHHILGEHRTTGGNA
jgi:phage tail-like protein